MGKICMQCGEVLNKDETQCRYCHSNNIDEFKSSATMGDYFIIRKISNDPIFIKTMLELHDTDIIEYNLKLSQFKTQLEQQGSNGKQNNTIPWCPHCHSADIQKISGLERAGSIAILGIFSKKINKSFKCKQCGYTW